MKNRIQKLALLFSLYVGMHFLAACFGQCRCGNVDFPFFDYHSMSVANNDPAVSSKLTLDITPTDIELLAAAEEWSIDFGFITSAMGCECIGDGGDGPKFPITSFKIFANRAFNDSLPVDSSLNTIFTYSLYAPSTNLETPLTGPQIYDASLPLRLTTQQQPKDPETAIRFTIQLIKNGNDTLTTETGAIYFK